MDDIIHFKHCSAQLIFQKKKTSYEDVTWKGSLILWLYFKVSSKLLFHIVNAQNFDERAYYCFSLTLHLLSKNYFLYLSSDKFGNKVSGVYRPLNKGRISGA